MIYFELFWVFFRISVISFGGVFGLLPELQRIIVDQHGWMTAEQFVQSYVVGSFVPGPNMAMCSLIGYHVAGSMGAIAASAGVYSGPVAIMGVGCALYYRGRSNERVRRAEVALRPLVFALIFSSAASFLWQQLGGHWILGCLIGVPIAVLNWKGKLGALTSVFVTGVVWWICASYLR